MKDGGRLAIIGCGMIARRYFQAASSMNVAIVAAADSDQRQLALAYAYGAACFNSAETMLDEVRDLDGVLVLAPNVFHAPLVRSALLRGYDVLCEKPLATTPRTAAVLLSEAESSGRCLYVAMHCRFRPEVRYVLDKGVSEVLEFEHSYEEDWTQAPDWYFNPVQSGGGVLLDVGINQIDWLYSLTASMRPKDVRFGFGNAAVEMDCTVTWRLDAGSGTTRWSWRAVQERKETRLETVSDQRLLLDHARHLVVDDGQVHGPWRNDEYERMLADFFWQREAGCKKQGENTVQVLELLRELYATGCLPYLAEQGA